MPIYKLVAPDGRMVRVSGDTPPTEDIVKQIFASLPQQEERRSYASGVTRAALNGYFGGLGDELAASGQTLGKVGPADAMYSGGVMDAIKKREDWQNKYDTEYDKQLERERKLQDDFAARNPVSSFVATLGGGIASPLTKLTPTTNGTVLGSHTLAKSLLGGASGATFGGLYGLAEGRGGLENRLQSAKRGAKWGGIIGGGMPLAKEAIKQVGNLGAETAGAVSGAGGASVKRGFEAGKRNSQVFKDAMRGNSSVYDVVDDVDRAVKTMERNASAKYKAMLPDNGATLKLPDTEFKKALKTATDSISGVTAGVDDTAANAINKVHKLAQNIKANGGMTFDNALEAKKAVDGIIEPLSRAGEKNAVRLLKPIKDALNATMEKAVPEYNGARAAFRADSRLIDMMKSALTSKDPTTELRKLQGITRQSVAAAQGGKQELGKLLDAVSGGRILDAVAGGQVQQILPRDPLRLAGTGVAALSATTTPMTTALLPAMSPRLVGEGAFALGRLAGGIEKAVSKLPQTTIPAAKTSTILPVLKALGY